MDFRDKQLDCGFNQFPIFLCAVCFVAHAHRSLDKNVRLQERRLKKGDEQYTKKALPLHEFSPYTKENKVEIGVFKDTQPHLPLSRNAYFADAL
jgi:hypothetical protein